MKTYAVEHFWDALDTALAPVTEYFDKQDDDPPTDRWEDDYEWRDLPS